MDRFDVSVQWLASIYINQLNSPRNPTWVPWDLLFEIIEFVRNLASHYAVIQ